jgi:hypothetical protein
MPYAIAIQLGVSQYTKGYSGAFRKEVVLGTGYRQPIKFLTAEDKPVEVLHLTGVLVDSTGRPVRRSSSKLPWTTSLRSSRAGPCRCPRAELLANHSLSR